MNIENTNVVIKDNAYILTYCANSEGIGKRITVITYNYKETNKEFKKAGFFLFGSPTKFINGIFFKLTKSFKLASRNKSLIEVANEMYHIKKSLEDNSLTFRN